MITKQQLLLAERKTLQERIAGEIQAFEESTGLLVQRISCSPISRCASESDRERARRWSVEIAADAP